MQDQVKDAIKEIEDKEQGKKRVVLASSEDARFDPGEFRRFLDKHSATASSGDAPQPLRKRVAHFSLSKDVCRLGAFDNDIRLTIEELNAADEEEALATLPVNSNEKSLSVALAKKALVALNGHRLMPHEVDMVWDAISFTGRLVAGSVYILHCAGNDEAALGNSLESVVVE